ncbi:LOW QUALITY PROTEIN: kelch domain-containing protein 9-like [Liolophura sinensis]|uniref:LOW QUALITY PROTEIN: kelch domain-containing protein 9-like n=1 Tax=Liolophura sinensis TaxID=3198878 RepID=UPI003158E363
MQTVKWEALAAGPLIAFHAGCILGDVLYLHGGVEEKSSPTPSNKFHSYNMSTSEWIEIQEAGSPALSHHACVVIENRYIVLIGGWDGKVRTSAVYIYDTDKRKWTMPQVLGFSDQGGLSAHTASLLASGEILVIGREGGLHMQRRHGDAYILSCDVEKRVCKYCNYTSSVSSRSGHTTNIVGNAAYIIGGRGDQLLERLLRFSPSSFPPSSGPIFSKLSNFLCTPLTKVPCGRKNHIALSGPGFIFVHGGETFDGRIREPVGEMYLVTIKPSVQWFAVRGQSLGRAGHVCCTDGNRVLLHGGLTGRGQVCGDVRELTIS